MSVEPDINIVIPARLHSTRLPGKVLLPVAGRPMLEWVWRQAQHSAVGEVFIATDHQRIADAAQRFGAQVVMTAASHRSGTDRCAEVAHNAGWRDDTLVINLQGDEPALPPACIQQLAELARRRAGAVTSLYQLLSTVEEWHDPAAVKLVCDAQGRALYFSRAAIPHHVSAKPAIEDGLLRRHIGLYAYPVGLLKQLTQLPVSPYEALEKLEQLRMLEAGIPIYLAAACVPVPGGVDTVEDYQRLCAAWSSETLL